MRTGDATGIERIFDQNKVQRDIDAQVAITAEFGKQASKAVGDYAQAQTEEARRLREQARAESDPQRRSELETQAKKLEDAWGDNGSLRLAAHTVIGGLTGGVGGAAGAAVGTLTAPTVAQALSEAGITGPLADVLTAAASTAAGAVAGGVSGAAAAGNEVANNYLSHKQWNQYAEELAVCRAKGCAKDEEEQIREKWTAISVSQNVALANCVQTQNCETLAKEATSGTEAMLELMGKGKIPVTAVQSDLGQYFGQRLASSERFRTEMNDALQAAKECTINPMNCNQKALRIALGVVTPILVGTAGPTIIAGMVGAGKLAASEAVLLSQMGLVNYCAIRMQGCVGAIEFIAGVSTGTNAPSVLPATAIPNGEIKGGAASAVSREALREVLAMQAGIPEIFIKIPPLSGGYLLKKLSIHLPWMGQLLRMRPRRGQVMRRFLILAVMRVI